MALILSLKVQPPSPIHEDNVYLTRNWVVENGLRRIPAPVSQLVKFTWEPRSAKGDPIARDLCHAQ